MNSIRNIYWIFIVRLNKVMHIQNSKRKILEKKNLYFTNEDAALFPTRKDGDNERTNERMNEWWNGVWMKFI